MKTLFRYVSRTFLASFVGIFLAILVIFLVTDFVDRAKAYTGPNWVLDVLELYAWKAVLVAQQLAPAAMLLAAGAAVSVIRKRGELTAVYALAFGPRAIYVPVAVWTALLCVGFVVFDELAVVKAGPRVDEITTTRFKRWGDWRFFFQPKQWFRLGDRVFYLRSGDAEAGFRDVTVLRLTADFELTSRIDAEQMHHEGGTTWRLVQVADRSFGPGGQSELRTLDEASYDLGAAGNAFRIRKGRPEQMRLPVLQEQIDARAEVGLPTQQFRLALHNRFAYPLAGFPAALLAVGLALRRERKGHLTTSLLEGLSISMGLWGVMVVCKTLVLSERMSPALAAWTPFVALVLAAAVVFARNDARFQRRPPPLSSTRR